VAERAVDPTLAGARRLDARNGTIELLGPFGTPGGVAETRLGRLREDDAVMEEIAPAAQLDGLAFTAALVEAHDLGEELERLLRLRSQQLHVREL
jgi:hypothetical protein